MHARRRRGHHLRIAATPRRDGGRSSSLALAASSPMAKPSQTAECGAWPNSIKVPAGAALLMRKAMHQSAPLGTQGLNPKGGVDHWDAA